MSARFTAVVAASAAPSPESILDAAVTQASLASMTLRVDRGNRPITEHLVWVYSLTGTKVDVIA